MNSMTGSINFKIPCPPLPEQLLRDEIYTLLKKYEQIDRANQCIILLKNLLKELIK